VGQFKTIFAVPFHTWTVGTSRPVPRGGTKTSFGHECQIGRDFNIVTRFDEAFCPSFLNHQQTLPFRDPLPSAHRLVSLVSPLSAASPTCGPRPLLRPRRSVTVRVLVTQPGAARQPPRRPRLCLAVPGPASEIAAAAEEEAEQEEYVRTSAVEMDAAVRRELAIRRLREDAEAEAGTGRSRRDFAVFETTRGDVLFTQSWTPAAADRVKYAHLPTPVH
jgi:hypothetical protein